jgi:hypothetical protein
VRWHATQQEQIGQRLDHIHRVQLARHLDRQALAGELVEQARLSSKRVGVPGMINELGPRTELSGMDQRKILRV